LCRFDVRCRIEQNDRTSIRQHFDNGSRKVEFGFSQVIKRMQDNATKSLQPFDSAFPDPRSGHCPAVLRIEESGAEKLLVVLLHNGAKQWFASRMKIGRPHLGAFQFGDRIIGIPHHTRHTVAAVYDSRRCFFERPLDYNEPLSGKGSRYVWCDPLYEFIDCDGIYREYSSAFLRG
jgi:hypothetical protein